jgi:predicted unusual protein kinase regulating ubiquinone biosynthesis (AarF/ABC1/UbiB family)
MHTVLCAWEAEMLKELDFEHEAANLEKVAHNLRRAGLEAVVPVPLPGLVSKRVLVMSFEEGFKITDAEALAVHGVDREARAACSPDPPSSRLVGLASISAHPVASSHPVASAPRHRR